MSDSDDDGPKAEETEEDAEMKKLLAGFVDETGADDDSDSSDSESGDEAREIEIEDNVLDHVVLAAADFESALEEFTEKTGVAPKIAGAIKGLGIKTARVSFEGSSFLEIIAPDPKSGGPIGNLLKASGISGLKPFHWAIRNERAEPLKDEVNKFGYTPDHISMFGAKEDGTPRKWEMLYLYGHKMGGITPFYINWANSDHPCETMPIVGDLIGVKVTAPSDDPVHKLIAHTESGGFSLEEGDASFELKFDSPEGEITYEATKMVGFRFPGFEDENGPIDGEEPTMPEFVMPAMPELLPVETGDYDDIPATEG
ncbi:expressed unknown protein [Seminavis robusta]|uniref:Glyoxalase-like domain-containing protein n=1 Tax=Seminavis robusta TaxID=568900 RepID=A0A9N8H4F9_9STRA|nr:expressed unknown protein [Seminavis robusta]|eukprot:Sro8_g006470.1 n/a (313) ;mRNA; r:10663-11601